MRDVVKEFGRRFLGEGERGDSIIDFKIILFNFWLNRMADLS